MQKLKQLLIEWKAIHESDGDVSTEKRRDIVNYRIASWYQGKTKTLTQEVTKAREDELNLWREMTETAITCPNIEMRTNLSKKSKLDFFCKNKSN